MKTGEKLRSARAWPFHRPSAAAGAALILTLGMLVLLSGLVLAFLLTVRTEYGAAKGYEGGTNARLLADSALNLVIGQVREASTQPGLAWTSQPGLMRTFHTGGKPVKSYKLYSADSLVEDGSFDPAKATDLPAASGANSWKTQPGLWTDLNAPVADLTQADPFDAKKRKMVYPIFDGGHMQLINDPASGRELGQMSLNKDGNADIEGFKVEEYATRAVTMPVKWLYLLKDGTLAPAKASGTAGDVEVLVPAGKEKTAQGEVNQPVARVAFWTDDETAKLNINTASEGTYWDTPVGNSQPGVSRPAESFNYRSTHDATFEWDLAERQGAQREYQRYTGHPATVCLSTIFGRQLLQQVGGERAPMIEEICKFTPRVTGAEYTSGGYASVDRDHSSKGGTKRAGPEGGFRDAGQRSADESTYAITPDGDRLYATIDEFLFSPNFGGSRSPWVLAPPAGTSTGRDTTREMLEMARFFLTASSKAPEQNLFNLPRVSIWPEMVSEARRTPVDKLIAFCATVGPKSGPNSLPFYFTRQNANDPKVDVSARNMAVLTYLQGLTGRPVPGGSSLKTFKDKYGADRDQILTEIFDYIRCTNLADKSGEAGGIFSSFTNGVEGPLGTVEPNGNFLTGLFPPDFSEGIGPLGQVVPIEIDQWDTRGIGRIPTISELALVMIRKGTNVEFSLVPMLTSPMAGFTALSMGVRLTFESIDIKVTELKADGTPLAVKYPFLTDPGNPQSGAVPQPTLYDVGRITNIEDRQFKVGGTMSFHSLCEGIWTRGVRGIGSPPDSVPPTGEVALAGGSFLFEGTVTVKISGTARPNPQNAGDEPVLQTMTFKFPAQQVPMPTSTGEMAVGGSGGNSRGNRISSGQSASLSGNDTIRSLVPVGKNLQADTRLIAARKVIDETYFVPAPNGAYADKSRQNNQNHSMRSGWPGNYTGSAFGSLFNRPDGTPVTNYGVESQPTIPFGIRGVFNSLGQPGDWDNGPAFVQDGALCNKPDEGTRRHLHGSVVGYEGTTASDVSAPYIGWLWNPSDAMRALGTFFSPNRLISSAVMFGSLPTGVKADRPWQTLLFRPAKAYLPGGTNHPGSAAGGQPPDHLLLDLFWMPVAEPYAISEPFATGGKINLNQQIAPFTNIRRDTGLRAVLKSVKITAMNPDQPDLSGGTYIQRYKLCGTPGNSHGGAGGGWGVIMRRNIDLDNTLKQISDRWDKNKPFISASEICEIPLIPQDLPTASGPVSIPSHVKAGFDPSTPLSSFDSLLTTFWNKHRLTGDNSLEKPYTAIYPLLTTRSNSYTVHLRVQTLPQNTRNSTFIIKAAQNQPTGEFRGSFLVERYLDANSAGIYDKNGTAGATGLNAGDVLGPYRFRVVSSKQFVP